MIWPSLSHAIYIPLTLLLGLGVGWYLGSRAVQQHWDRAERRRRREEEGL